MIVLHLTDCPLSLRGDLTRWLLEISSGVFVGQVSARVRDALWHRVQANCKNGRATLVYSSGGEQRLSFKVHGDVWEPIDFDGLKLMLRPSVSRLSARTAAPLGFSDAAKRRKAKRFSQSTHYPADYIVIDIETSGTSPDEDEIIEIGAIKVIAGEASENFQKLVRIGRSIPPAIIALTGITDEMLARDGVMPEDALAAFRAFIADMPLVAHSAGFDLKFLLRACKKHGLPLFTNRSIDTLSTAQRLLRDLPNHKLETLAEHFGLQSRQAHRSLADCEATRLVYEKLIKIAASQAEKSPE